ncbi:MAG: hypothetical protein ACC628_18690 [Pirellulaceae bacterium]
MNRKPATNGRLRRTVDAFRELLVDNLYYSHGQAVQTASKHDAYMALCYSVRDYLIERWRKTTEAHYRANPIYRSRSPWLARKPPEPGT